MNFTLQKFNQQQLRGDLPGFAAGDTLRIVSFIKEGSKTREQRFEGLVIKRQGTSVNEAVLVRKQSKGVAVERLFRIHSPRIKTIEVLRSGKVRRAHIYYMRQRQGKVARIKQTFKKRNFNKVWNSIT